MVGQARVVAFVQMPDQVLFDHFRTVVRAATKRVRRLEAALMQQATSSPQVRTIAARQTLRGIGFLSAVTIVAEVGDLRRFGSARQLMAYASLVPSEHSSGASQHRGRITETGSARISATSSERPRTMRAMAPPRRQLLKHGARRWARGSTGLSRRARGDAARR